MEYCNESERQSVAGAHSTDAATLTGAAATAIEPAAAPSKKPQTALIAVPAPAMGSAVSPLETEKADGAKTDSLGTRPSKPAVDPALPITKADASEIEQEAAKASLTAVEAAKLPRGKPGVPNLDWIKALMASERSVPPPEVPAAAADSAAAGVNVPDRPQPRSRRFALLAASLAVAAGLGAVAGALGAYALASPAALPTPSPLPVAPTTEADDTQSVKATVAQLRADLSALRVTIETANKAASGQLAKISERFDRMERERRADTGAAKETTGSLLSGPAPAPTTAPSPTGPAAAPPAVPGWAVRDVYRGVALIQGPRFGLIEVEAGDVIPGIGRVESIRKQDGHWVVTTSRGIIASR
jgi:hypothetical protein